MSITSTTVANRNRLQRALPLHFDNANENKEEAAIAAASVDAHVQATQDAVRNLPSARRRRRSRAPLQATARRAVPPPAAILDPDQPTALSAAELTLLKSYVQTADDESRRYFKAADANRRKRTRSNFVLLVLLFLTSGGSILYDFGSLSMDSPTYWPRLIFNVLSVAAAVVRALQQAFNFDEKTLNYEMTGDHFFNFAREWRMRLAQGVDNRRDKCVEALVVAESRLTEIEINALPL